MVESVLELFDSKRSIVDFAIPHKHHKHCIGAYGLLCRDNGVVTEAFGEEVYKVRSRCTSEGLCELGCSTASPTCSCRGIASIQQEAAYVVQCCLDRMQSIWLGRDIT